jgi:NADH-quinone oxidoreductase subunit G
VPAPRPPARWAGAQARRRRFAAVGQRKAVLLGNAAAQHPQAAQLLALAQWIGQPYRRHRGLSRRNRPTPWALSSWARCPGQGGLNAGQMLTQPMKALLLLNVEPVLDSRRRGCRHGPKALAGSGLVVALTPFKDANAEFADVLLPIAPFTETSPAPSSTPKAGCSRSTVWSSPLGDTRPAWKVLRVLGNLLGLPGFDVQETVRGRAPCRRWGGRAAPTRSATADNSACA